MQLDLSTWTTPELKAGLSCLQDLRKALAIEPSDYEAKFEQLSQDFRDQLSGYASDLANENITADEFHDRMVSAIKQGYVQAYRQGAGSVVGRTTLSDADIATIADYLKDEWVWLGNFSRQAGLEDFSAAYLDNRTSLYADAVRGLYWAGKTSRQGDGTLIYWKAMAGCCESCQAVEAGSPYTQETLPGMPGADVCDGLDHCRCELEYVQSIPPDESDQEAA